MKIAILSDIHGNLAALQAVADAIADWRPDQVVVAGDTVNRGPDSLACWQFVQQQARETGWQLMMGNHEEYIIDRSRPDFQQSGPLQEMTRMSYWTYRQMQTEIPILSTLPHGYSLAVPDGSECRVRHASMQHNRDGIYPDTEEARVVQQIEPAPAVFGTGHIHHPFVRRVNGSLIANCGSVGAPADGDSRASYAQISWQSGQWSAQIARVVYDRDSTERRYADSGLLLSTGPFTWLIYYEWKLARYVLPPWIGIYWQDVLAGDIALETAVTNHLQELGLPVPVH